MKKLILILAGLILGANTLLSNGDYCDIPLPHYSFDQHTVIIPEEPKPEMLELMDIELIYTILTEIKSTKVRASISQNFPMIQAEDANSMVMTTTIEMENSKIEIER